MSNKVEEWKREKHGFDVWPDVLRYSQRKTPMKDIDNADLERMKWYGVFYRKRDGEGTYMMRIRITACELTAEQAREIAFLAYEYGYGIIDVTTRANLQVQGLSIENVPRAVKRLEAVGLTAKQTGHDNIRNVFCHPLSGLDPQELLDTRQLCHDVAAIFLDSRVYADLPRKFNIAINGKEQHGIHYWTQDISYLAHKSGVGEVAFQVLVAGTQGQNPQLARCLPISVEPAQVVPVTRALLDLFRERGSREKRDRARFRYLVDEIGVPGVLHYLGGRLPFALRRCEEEPSPPTGYDELVGWLPQSDPERWAMGLCIPVGRLTWQQLEGLAVASTRWGDGSLRTTHEQGLIIPNIPTSFKDAAATAAAAQGLSVHADTLALNTVACTGKQFCNIAVTEAKGHMFHLIEKLRQRALTLHGIRIHMSGCPSSCAGHFTADIGLKGVRVRRLLGTREGFDVFLGGGVAGQIHLAQPYCLGVDVDQLPQLIEEVTREYYLKHKPGQTFSAYWRESLREREALKVEDGEFTPPTWVCEACNHRFLGEDPPVFCPSCAGLRRNFARLEPGEQSDQGTNGSAKSYAAPSGTDGFVFAADEDALAEGKGLTVEVAGRDVALFRIQGQVTAIDSACPHEGAPLAEGTVSGNVVTCPWHGWTFNACTGCSIDPAGNDVTRHETKVEAGKIYVKLASADRLPTVAAAPALVKPVAASLSVLEIIEETPDTKTFRLDNSAGAIPAHYPGQFARVCVLRGGKELWRSFTISSSPSQRSHLDLTIKRNPGGVVSNFLHDGLKVGDKLAIKAPQGGFFLDESRYAQPLVLISAGSGITPMMSILRHLAESGLDPPCTFIHGARTENNIIFGSECLRLAETMPRLKYCVSLSQPTDTWSGFTGRVDMALVEQLVSDVPAGRYFLCGPGSFMDALREGLADRGVPAERIHTEAFQPAPAPTAAS